MAGVVHVPRGQPRYGRRINWTNPLSNGLRGCWVFNAGVGTLIPDLVHHHDPLSISGSTWQDGRNLAEPQLGYALDSCAAVGQRTQWGATSLLATSTQRWTAWLAMYSYFSEGYLFGRVTSKANATFAIRLDGSLDPNVTLRGTETAATGNPLSEGYNTVAVTWDGATARLYLSGLQIDTPAVGLTAEETSAVLSVGYHPDFDVGVDAMLALQIWDRNLSAAELVALHQRPYALFQTPAPRRLAA